MIVETVGSVLSVVGLGITLGALTIEHRARSIGQISPEFAWVAGKARSLSRRLFPREPHVIEAHGGSVAVVHAWTAAADGHAPRNPADPLQVQIEALDQKLDILIGAERDNRKRDSERLTNGQLEHAERLSEIERRHVDDRREDARVIGDVIRWEFRGLLLALGGVLLPAFAALPIWQWMPGV